MARENVRSTINVRYTGTNLSGSDVGGGLVAVLVNDAPSQTGGARPTVTKAPTGTGADGTILGTIQTVESPTPSPNNNRAPSGQSIGTVATSGTLLVKKSTAPIADDVGDYLAIDTDAGRTVGTVKTAGTGTHLIIDITGTTTDDFLVVLFR